MKKIYLSIPTEGRKTNWINYSRERATAAAQALLNDDVEVLVPVVDYITPDGANYGMWNVNNEIQAASKADYLITTDSWNDRACNFVREVYSTYASDETIVEFKFAQLMCDEEKDYIENGYNAAFTEIDAVVDSETDETTPAESN